MGWLEQQREKQKREAQSRKLASKFARGLDTPSGNPFGRWAQGVAQRTMHPLETLAGVAQQSLDDPMGTALNWSNPIAGGMVGIFAGKGAKTANLANLEIAQKLKQQGIPDELIWKKTGWTLDTPDKLPRFEIPDDAATINLVNDAERGLSVSRAGLGDALKHPSVYMAYPDTSKIGATIYQGDTPTVGSFSSFGGEYDVKFPRRSQIRAAGLDAKSVTLHELQHAIQQREGFARGGSPEQFRNVKEINRTKELADNVASVASHKFDQLPDELKQYARAINRGDDIGGDAYAKIAAHPQAKVLWADYVQAQNQVKELLGGPQQIDMLTPTEQYKRLAGEAEARLTQARMNMTPEQRLAQYPYEPQYFQKATGVPLRDLIVRTQ